VGQALPLNSSDGRVGISKSQPIIRDVAVALATDHQCATGWPRQCLLPMPAKVFQISSSAIECDDLRSCLVGSPCGIPPASALLALTSRRR